MTGNGGHLIPRVEGDTVTLDTTYTRLSEVYDIRSHQNTQCARYEMRWMKCMSASGLARGKDFCQDYFDDFYECINGAKQMMRVWKMQEVRKKLGRAFLEPPPFDSYQTYQPDIRRERW